MERTAAARTERPRRYATTEESRRAALPGRSGLPELTRPDAFLWATGIEDTFIVDPHHKTERELDEYELTEHYSRWREDLDLVASLGVDAVRYGIPWYKVQPSKDKWDWSFPDKTFDRLLELGVEPIVDLVHYGVPGWIEGSLLDPDFPPRMAEYGQRMAERYKGRIRWFTPLNEPRVNAWYCGKIGWWPPYRHGWSGFAQIAVSLARGIAATTHALRQVDREIVIVNVDATDVYSTEDPAMQDEVALRRKVVYLPMDLATGRVGQHHELYAWLRRHKVAEDDLDWLCENGAEPDLMGLNLYPMYSDKRLSKGKSGVKTKMPYGRASMIDTLARGYYERYGLPMIISETAASGSHERRLDWLEDSLGVVRNLRESGVPLVGYTWWPLFALFGWGYRQGTKELWKYVVQMGLWDLDEQLDRIETPVAERYRQVVSEGTKGVGRLSKNTAEVGQLAVR